MDNGKYYIAEWAERGCFQAILYLNQILHSDSLQFLEQLF